MKSNIFTKVSDVVWEAPANAKKGMNVPARVYATQAMLKEMERDRSLEQLLNVSTLPGVLSPVMVMPDAHEGYGFPIGGVAAALYPDGIISPGGIGYDINCGVRLLKSDLEAHELASHVEKLALALYHAVPSGVGRGGSLKLNLREMDLVLKNGVKQLTRDGYATAEDMEHIESGGCLSEADPAMVSDLAKKRGHDQLGTMGAGNHFVEVDVIDTIFEEEVAAAYGLRKGQVVVLIHTGSRGLGHQVCTDYLRVMMNAMPKYGIRLVDNELACVPLSSEEGTRYFRAMAAAANFAWANRQMITHEVREAWLKVFGHSGGSGVGAGRRSSAGLEILYDVAHNMAKIEEHIVNGKKRKLIVHRKGATRAFGPGHPELAEAYRDVGQPVLIPGSMGTASYVLAGTDQAMQETFGSSCHGAGRRLSRHAALRAVEGHELLKGLSAEGIHIQTGSIRGLAEEAPLAYKDVDEVVDVVARAGIAKKVARLRPVVVIKG